MKAIKKVQLTGFFLHYNRTNQEGMWKKEGGEKPLWLYAWKFTLLASFTKIVTVESKRKDMSIVNETIHCW